MFIIKNELKIIAILLSRVNHWAETVSLLEGRPATKIVKIRIRVIIAKHYISLVDLVCIFKN